MMYVIGRTLGASVGASLIFLGFALLGHALSGGADWGMLFAIPGGFASYGACRASLYGFGEDDE